MLSSITFSVSWLIFFLFFNFSQHRFQNTDVSHNLNFRLCRVFLFYFYSLFKFWHLSFSFFESLSIVTFQHNVIRHSIRDSCPSTSSPWPFISFRLLPFEILFLKISAYVVFIEWTMASFDPDSHAKVHGQRKARNQKPS